jgi:hypothetical protein
MQQTQVLPKEDYAVRLGYYALDHGKQFYTSVTL